MESEAKRHCERIPPSHLPFQVLLPLDPLIAAALFQLFIDKKY